MDNFSLLHPKLALHGRPIIHRPTYPGMIGKMENQNDRKEWNARLLRQIEEWDQQVERLLEEAEALLALIQ